MDNEILDQYEKFLKAKVKMAESLGFDIQDEDVNPILKPHQRAMVRWMVRMGRAACFAAFGLGKSVIQLEAVRIILANVGGKAIIVVPLSVRHEFARDAAMLGIRTKFIRRIEECDSEIDVYLTNYESVRDGKLDPQQFNVASLDEASCLRGFGGTKTFREFMAVFAGDRKTMNDRIYTDGVKYRFVATATPSPNEYIELLAYAAFLGVMDVGQAKTRFFKRDSTKADTLTIHPHKEREFWLWVASWGLFVQKPSDLGFSDEGYALPDMDIRWHEIAGDHADAGVDFRGQHLLIKEQAVGLSDVAKEKRESIAARVERIIKIIDNDVSLKQRGEQYGQRPEAGVHAGVLRKEQREIAGASEGKEQGELPGEARCLQSANKGVEGEESREDEATSAGLSREEQGESEREKQAALPEQQGRSPCAEQASKGGEIRDNRDSICGVADDPRGSLCNLQNGQAIPKNGQLQNRPLPHDRQSARPFVHEVQQRAWHVSGQTGPAPECDGLSDQIVIWCDLNAEQTAIEKALKLRSISYTSLYGAQGIDEREVELTRWKNKQTSVLLTKPTMYGAGVNLQQCHTMIFSGINYKAQDFLQSIHRIHRFLQEHTCNIHVIYTEQERAVRGVLETKAKQHKTTVDVMTKIIHEFGLSNAAMEESLQRAMGVERIEVTGVNFKVAHNDCIKETMLMESSSVDMILTSVPFSTQYEYSPNYADLGHTDNNAHFFEQMDFLTPELMRVLKPGRIAAIHVKDRIVPGGLTGLGYQTVYPFHMKCTEHYSKHGFGYMGMITVVTDVVRENNQTYRLGWTEVCKDGSKISVGMPEYILLFRKAPTDTSNAYADEPVTKHKPDCQDDEGNVSPFVRGKQEVPGTGYSRARWQTDAHGFWRSNGNRYLTPDELETLSHAQIFRWFRDFHIHNIYDYEHHVKIAETLTQQGRLPSGFMLLQPPSHLPDVWTDVARMRTLNMLQQRKGQEQHLCPMQWDIADRLIDRFTNKGETVYDPFGGIMTVPYRAILKGRKGRAAELSLRYFFDGVHYLQAAEREIDMPSLFDTLPVPDEVESSDLPEELEAA